MIATRLGSRGLMLAGVVVALLLFAATWLLVISPVRSDASQLRDDAASVQTQNNVIAAQNNKLRDEAANQTELVAQLETALNELPSGPGLPVFSRQLARQATDRGLSLTGVAIGTPVSSAPAAAPATGATTTDSAAGTTTTTPAPATTPITGGPLAIPITVTTTGPALQQLQFLRDVQQVGPRLALVTSTALVPADSTDGASASIDANATLTLQVTVFTRPLDKTTREQLASLTGTADTGSGSGAGSSADQG